MKTIIMAGGKGTRIASIANEIPKPMIQVGEMPILEHEIRCLERQGYTDIILVVGHMGNVIKEYFEDGGRLGVSIQYFTEDEPLGTAGALFCLKDILCEDFFLLNADIMLDVNFHKMELFHRKKAAWATLLTHPNNHPYDSALIQTDSESRILNWLHKEDKRGIYKNRVNAGVHILSKNVLENVPLSRCVDLDRDLLKPLVSSGKLFAYDSPEYIKDMGTPERYHNVCRDFNSGKIQSKNLHNKQKAIFLDRDGTINQPQGFITKPEQLTLIKGTADAINIINKSEYLAIVITNQPVIARGECTFEELERIHNQLETLLGAEGAYIDDIFFCPHHPDRGFKGERLEYKIPCDCRKPKTGLFRIAAEKYNIDLKQSYMVGDSERDMLAGMAAGCCCIYVGDNPALSNSYTRYSNLYEFVNTEISTND